MWKVWMKCSLIVFLLFITARCRKSYDPPAIAASNHFLAVDGVINTGLNGVSVFTLTRSLNLSDTVTNIPERNALLTIAGASGSSFQLTDSNNNGIYYSAPLSLNVAEQYQLLITTSDGRKFASDLVTPKTCPPIDSVNWVRAYDAVYGTDVLNIYVNSHDPSNNTRYYRWQYEETWEHASVLSTPWAVNNGMISAPYSADSLYNFCWSTQPSSNILLATTVALSADIASQVLINKIPQNDPRMDIEYSLLVKQYPLDASAYNYWLTVQKNSQSLGGLFDLQPSKIVGNIHGLTNAGDIVLGYVSASSIQEQRIFIQHYNGFSDWKSTPAFICPLAVIASDPSNSLIWNYSDTAWSVYYFNSGSPPTINISTKQCLNCTYQGGTNIPPPFWH